MAYRELELTLLSAQELKSVNLITRMHVYAVVSISGDRLTRECTAPDTYGGRNPCWNVTFRFVVPPTAAAAAGASLHVLLRAERFFGDRDVGEVVVPLSDVLAGASGVGPQLPHVASYQVRKVHRWEPRGVLNVSYRLGPVVAPVVERAAPDKAAVNFEAAYAPVGVLRQPYHQHPSDVAYQAPPAPSRPSDRVVAEHDEAAQNKSPVVMAYPVGVPPQQASHLPAKPDAYRPPTPTSPPRPATVHAARHQEAPAPAPAPPPRNGGSNGLGQAGPIHVYMGPHTQIIFGGAPTTTAGPPIRTTSPARSIISPAGKDDVNWALLHDTYASATEAMSVISPRSRKEDRWRPSVLSQSQHDTHQQAASSPVAAAPSHRLAAASPFSSRSSYSSAHPSPSSSFRSTSRGAAISSPLPSSSPMVPNHSRGAAVSSPLPNHSRVVPSL